MPDANLQLAMNQIQDILRAHDCMGVIVLASKTHSEFRISTETTWTCTTDHPDGFRITSKRADFPSKEAQDKMTADTIGSIGLLVDTAKHITGGLMTLWARLAQHVQVTGKNTLEE